LGDSPEQVPLETDLHIVSQDRDYASVLDKTKPNHFLTLEWNERKHAQLFVHDQLKPFLAAHFAGFDFASDPEKAKAIRAFVNSGAFWLLTKPSLSSLRTWDELSAAEAEEILTASLRNSQIAWIATDEDVRDLIRRVFRAHSTGLDPVLVSEARQMLRLD
jgi:hypothetical protein